jgi:ABC-type dipeptide/oligopeptide/nickel transport system permease component
VAGALSAWRWLAGRLAGALGVWLLISVLAFTLGTLAPGDPAQMILLRRTGDVPSQADVERLREELGLNRPLPVRYGTWVAAAARGDLGTSYRSGTAVLDELRARFPATLTLAFVALLLSLALAIPLALLSVARRDGPADHVARVNALVGVSMPSYWLGYVLMLVFAVQLGWLPVSGAGGARHLILPALTLAVGGAASIMRVLRANLLDELGADYIRTARAKGLSGWLTLTRHALRNALNPLVTLSALRFGRLLGEAVIVETVFAWPGIGRWMVESIYDRDYPAIQGFVLYSATVFILLTVVVDAAYRVLDPRVRPGTRTLART